MADSTGSPWNLPSPTLPEAPDGPGNIQDLAASVHSALGRAYPCVSTARPDPVAGMLIYETDTARLLVSPEGSTWRVVVSAPGTTTAVTNALTAATNFTLTDQRLYVTGGTVHWTAYVTRTTSDLTSPASGNIANTAMLNIGAGYRPPPGAWGCVGGTLYGPMAIGYANGTDYIIYVTALNPSVDWTVGQQMGFSGSWPSAEA